MASLNKVLLMGNLTRDPELRYIPSGTAVATFTVAANRAFTNQAGEKKEEACFVRVVVWARRAEVCAEFLTKGSPVFVEGRLQSRNWQDQSGQKRSTIEIIASDVQFMGRPKGSSAVQEPTPPAQQVDEAPAPDMDIGGEIKQNSEEVPF